MSVVLARQNFENRSHEETLHQEGCACRAAWDLANIFTSSRGRTKLCFYTFIDARVMPAPTSKRPEREFAVDSASSMHMMNKKTEAQMNWALCEGPGTPVVVLTANGEVYTYQEAQAFSRSKSIRDCATTRGNASSSIALKTLRRPRILQRVGQR